MLELARGGERKDGEFEEEHDEFTGDALAERGGQEGGAQCEWDRKVQAGAHAPRGPTRCAQSCATARPKHAEQSGICTANNTHGHTQRAPD